MLREAAELVGELQGRLAQAPMGVMEEHKRPGVVAEELAAAGAAITEEAGLPLTPEFRVEGEVVDILEEVEAILEGLRQAEEEGAQAGRTP